MFLLQRNCVICVAVMTATAGTSRQKLGTRLRLLRRRVGRWALTPGESAGLEIAVAAIALLISLSSYAFLTGKRMPAEGLAPSLVAIMLLANLLPLLTLLFLIGRRIAVLMANRRAGRAGAQLHVRLVALFAALAALPTLLVVIFAALLFQFGVQFWFSDRARTVLDNADQVAQAYVAENKSRLLDDIVAMGRDISDYRRDFGEQSPSFHEGLAFQVAARDLSEAAVFHQSSNGPAIIASVSPEDNTLPERTARLDTDGIQPGEARVIASARDRIEAIVRLDTTDPIYVYTNRKAEPRVLQQVARTQRALSEYKALTERSRILQWRFNLMLMIMSLLIVAVAVWFALLLATNIVEPIGKLSEAAERVGRGDLNAHVKLKRSNDEIAALARSFNRMTEQLKTQQHALLDANTQSESRRRFTEAVLSGVSAGVFSVDDQDIITLANASAEMLLDCGPNGLVGRRLPQAAPEFADLVALARQEGVAAGEISRTRPQGRGVAGLQTLAVRLTADAGPQRNYIVTFDDITQQLVDQRRAAWSDVARRIAHEIKNPLTPIILSAERLKRRFAPKIADGQDTFEQLTDTIVRQAGDMRRMVDEFSAFARMPTPVFQNEQLAEIISQAVFLAEVAFPDVKFILQLPVGPLPDFACDRRQISQALTNILKNAAESIQSKQNNGNGEILIQVSHAPSRLCIEILDSGSGIPAELQEKLFEPYVTTRKGGTGLGLAIVRRIIEDHKGRLEIGNRPEGGACVRMEFDLAANAVLLTGLEEEQTGD